LNDKILDEAGKVNWKELKYNKKELFAKTPIFKENMPRFEDVLQNPNSDPIII